MSQLSLMSSGYEHFTAAQQQALRAASDTLVTAAAGSGKTGVLVARIVTAVEAGTALSRIVAVTYTERAAQELRERVGAALAERGLHQQLALLDRAPIGTIHSLCATMLRRYWHRAGIDPSFRVLDAAQARYVRGRALQRAFETAAGRNSQFVQLRARYGDRALRTYIEYAIETAGQRPDGRVRFAVAADGDVDATHLQELLELALAEYATAKKAAGALDFDDLQQRTLRLLRKYDDVVADVRFRYSHVLVDEFQDTNALQCELMQRIAGSEMFAVGDEWQSIYRFRHADVEVFRAWAAARSPVVMADNFRSHPQIVAVVNSLFTRAFGERFAPLQAARGGEEEDALRCELVLVDSGNGCRTQEAVEVAIRVRRLLDGGADPAQIVLLLARHTHAGVYEQKLVEAGVPVLRTSSRGFFEQQQVADVLQLLTWVCNETDERACLSVLAAPYVGLTPAELWHLRQSGPSLKDAVSASEDPRVRTAFHLRAALVSLAENGSIVDVVEHAVHGVGYDRQILMEPDGLRRYANMRKLIELACASHAAGTSDLAAFVEMLCAQKSIAGEGEAGTSDEAVGAVRILTVHAAKGLEFDHVFVCELGSTGPQQTPKVLADTSGSLAFSSVDEYGATGSEPEQLTELRRAEADKAADEERRLMYVALTRARESLTLTGTCDVDKWRSERKGAQGTLKWFLPLIDDVVPHDDHQHSLSDPPLLVTVASSDRTDLASVTEARRGSAPVQSSRGTWPDSPPAIVTVSESLADEMLSSVHGAVVHAPAGSAADEITCHDDATRAAARDRGVDLHEQLARAAIDGGALADDVPPAVHEIVARLRERRARVEVPYYHLAADGSLQTGRMDAVVIDDSDRSWWIVDYKLNLPADDADAWRAHEQQLNRYAAAAAAAGAGTVSATLVSLADGRCVSRDLYGAPSSTPLLPLQ